MYQRQTQNWMRAVVSNDPDRASSDQDLLEYFEESGISSKEATDFLEHRSELFALSLVA